MLSADWSLTDRTTWVALLTVVAAVCADVFHASFAQYVPAAATLAAGIAVGLVALAKHHYAAALSSLAATIPAAKTEAPQLPSAVTQGLSTAVQALQDVTSLIAAPRAPQASSSTDITVSASPATSSSPPVEVAPATS